MLSVQNKQRRRSLDSARQYRHCLRKFEPLENRLCLSVAANWGVKIAVNDSVQAVAADNDGSHTYTAATNVSGDTVLIKHNSDSPQSPPEQTTVGTTLTVTDLAVAPDGYLFVAGTFSADVDLDPENVGGELVSRGGEDGFVAKYTSDLGLVWTQRLGGMADDEFSALAVTSSHVYVVGTFQESIYWGDRGTELLTSTVDDDERAGLVVKLSSTGPNVDTSPPTDVVWANQLQDSGSVEMAGIAVSEPEVFVAGTFRGSGGGRRRTAVFDGQVLTTGKGYDAFALKLHEENGSYPPTAVVDWAYQIARTEFNARSRASALALSPDPADGALYVAGSFHGPAEFEDGERVPLRAPEDLHFYGEFYDDDGYVMRIVEDSVGAPTYDWIRQIQCNNDLRIRSIAVASGSDDIVTKSPSLFVAGDFLHTAEFHPEDAADEDAIIFASYEARDAFLLELELDPDPYSVPDPEPGGRYLNVWQVGALESDDVAVDLTADATGSVYLVAEGDGLLTTTPSGTLESAGSDKGLLTHVNPSAPQLRIPQLETLIEQQQPQLGASAKVWVWDGLQGKYVYDDVPPGRVHWSGTLKTPIGEVDIIESGYTLSLPISLSLGAQDLTLDVKDDDANILATYDHHFDVSPNAPWIDSFTVTAKGKTSDITLRWTDRSHDPADVTGFYVDYLWGPWGFTWERFTVGKATSFTHNVRKDVPDDSVTYRVRSYAIVNEDGVDRVILSPVTEGSEISLDPARRGTVTFPPPESPTSLTDIGSALQSLTAQQATDPDALVGQMESDEQSQTGPSQVLVPVSTIDEGPAAAPSIDLMPTDDGATDTFFAELEADSLEHFLLFADRQ